MAEPYLLTRIRRTVSKADTCGRHRGLARDFLLQLQQQRHGKGGIVEMPAKLLTLACIMHIDRGQRVGIFVKRGLADHLRQKRPEFR